MCIKFGKEIPINQFYFQYCYFKGFISLNHVLKIVICYWISTSA